MQININDMTIDWEFKKASKYLPVRLSTTYFDGIGECICIVANRAEGMEAKIIENQESEVFLTINEPSLYNTIKSAVLNMDFWIPNTHYNTVSGLADGVTRKIHLDGMVFLTDVSMNKLTKDFPFSKDEIGNIIMTVELLIMNVCKNASKEYPTQILQIQRGYQTLKYPLIAVWEYYGFGNKEEVMGISSPVHYEAFKIDPEDLLVQYIDGMPRENPFNSFGIIPNSEKVVEKLVLIYRHLLENLRSGRIKFQTISY